MTKKSALRVVVAMMEPPLPFGNAAARWYYVLLKGLVERGHRVTALATCSKPNEIAKAQELFPLPSFDLRCYPHSNRNGLSGKWNSFRRPYSYMFSPEFERDLQTELAKGFDILHLEQLWCAWQGLRYVDRTLVNVHHLTWIDLQNATPVRWRDRYANRRMFATEARLIRAFKFFRSSTPRVIPEIKRVNHNAQVTNVALGMDADKYPYIPDESRGDEPIISVIGSMNWYPSYSAAKRLITRLWPEIKSRIPNAKLQIVGWSARSVLGDYVGLPDVSIEENVPDTRPYFERTSVFVYAPARGSGMKVKVLEAFAYGVPVVTTSEGVEGIPAIHDVHAGVCDDDEGLIRTTIELLLDRKKQNRQRRAARQLFEEHCGPRQTLDGIEQIYDKMLNGQR